MGASRMDLMEAESRVRRLSPAQIRHLVQERPNGIDAMELVHYFQSEGYTIDDIGRAFQEALEAGLIDLGKGLRLFSTRERAA
jgi:hypothetical protein